MVCQVLSSGPVLETEQRRKKATTASGTPLHCHSRPPGGSALRLRSPGRPGQESALAAASRAAVRWTSAPCSRPRSLGIHDRSESSGSCRSLCRSPCRCRWWQHSGADCTPGPGICRLCLPWEACVRYFRRRTARGDCAEALQLLMRGNSRLSHIPPGTTAASSKRGAHIKRLLVGSQRVAHDEAPRQQSRQFRHGCGASRASIARIDIH